MGQRIPSGSHVHIITPGDHFSPSTGSAIPTVVHGLASATPDHEPRTRVAVARGTYMDRYPTADVLEYEPAAARRLDRYADLISAGVRLPRRGARRMLGAALASQSTWPPSVILAHNAPQVVPLVDTRLHVPVLYAHNELLRTYSHRESAATLAAAPVIACVSDFLAERTAQRLPVSLRGRVATVPNGVDITFFRPDPGRTAGQSVHVVYVGRMFPDKGPDVLVDAIARLRRPDLHATLMGTVNFAPGAPISPYERRLRRMAAPLGDRVKWLPFQPRHDVAAVLRSADVVVVPSRWAEPFALTVLEGMASGAAVVATRTGGIPEAAGDAAILVSPGDPVALAEALEWLTDDRTALKRLRASARKHALANDWASSRRRLDAVLKEHGVTNAAAGTVEGMRP